MGVLKSINVNDTKLAPKPNHGVVAAIYEVVEALGGATEEQVYRYLPAAIKDDKKVTHRVLSKQLYNAVYRGYLIHTPDGYYKIAPMSYYISRNAFVRKQVQDSRKRSGKNVDPRRVVHLPVPGWKLATLFFGGFLLGWMLGLGAGVML